MEYLYEDTAGGQDKEPAAGSIIALLNEHRERYVFHTSIGDIVMRRTPIRMERLIGNIIRTKYPTIMAEAEEMRDYMEGLIGLQESEYPEGAAEKISDYALRIKGPMTWKACGVIVSPQINSDEDYNDLYAMLAAKGEGEEFVLDEWVAELSTIRTEYDDTPYNIAERYNVEMLDRELIENLTVSQAQYFSRRIERENRMIERLNRK